MHQSLRRVMPYFLSVVPKFSEISEAYYEKNTKERVIIQMGKKIGSLAYSFLHVQYSSQAKNKVIL